ncbi:hypothetical protein L873DRAFT_1302289 [Choiromyces venosus 120613-1]|uniref:Uncharacterized protein n=1 Tax=Choiromyces venosus 120613-1 TaxID=1336337 RepID=A0A3N4JED5_9PEZI|nr:hypothetical protein L873DRAFT_1302289 [Choiromyces venosus 120613-1]
MAWESEQTVTSLNESVIIHNSMTAPEAEAEGALSAAGGVIRYNIRPREGQLKEDIVPLPKIKRRKKATVPPKKRPNRSCLLSVAPDKTADSLGNSGDETDSSRASASGTGKTRKGSKKLGKKATRSGNIEDILKKGSESFFPSSQSEELTSSTHEGAKGHVLSRNS